MKIAVSGSHGTIGTALLPALDMAGHQTVRLVRGTPGPGEVRWDPPSGQVDVAGLEGVGAVVNLAGVGIADRRWNHDQKDNIRASRIQATGVLAAHLATLAPPPSVLLNASAVGFYGDRGSQLLDETAAPGTGWLAELCRDWEAATAPAADAGIRVVLLRTGLVLTSRGGALKRQLPLFRLGLGGRLGPGHQYQSWISIDDEVGAIVHALGEPSLAGPLNLTAPNPVTNAELTRVLGRVLHRPAVLAVPAAALGIALGRELVTEMLLASQRVMPGKLTASGYSFRTPELEGALRHVLGRSAA